MRTQSGTTFLSRLLGMSVSPSLAPALTTQAVGQSIRARPIGWENDPRWGREHWRIRREPIQWPDKARVAVVLGIPFGFPDLGLKTATEGFTGAVQRVHINLYGARRGVWYLLDILQRHSFRGSFEINGFTAAQFPDAVKEINRRGHEIVGYSWAINAIHDQQSVNQDRQLIRHTLTAIEGAVGRRPVGWVAPELRLGERTLDFLMEEGIQWHACGLSDDLPYVVHVNGKRMIVVPHAHRHLDDAGFVIGTRRSPDVFLDFLKREFITLYREGEKMPKMFNFSVHPEYGGRPFFLGAIEEMLTFLRGYPDVWFTTRQQIVDWWNHQNYS